MDLLLLGALLLILLLVSIFWYKNASWNLGGKALALPPGPRGLPIVGYLPFMGSDMLRKLTDLSHKYGPIYKLRLGSKLAVVITSPSLVKQVIRDQDLIFAHRNSTVAGFTYSRGAKDLVFSPPNSRWRAMGKMLVRETQSSSGLDVSYQLRKEQLRKAIGYVYSKSGEAVGFGELVFQTQVNVVINLMSEETNGKVVDSVDKILESLINEREKLSGSSLVKNGVGRKDFLQIVLELKENKDSDLSALSKDQLNSLLIEIVSEGSDTVATTVDFAMAELLNSPEAMREVQKELSDVVGMNSMVEEFHLPKLHYLKAVIKETLRLHPPVPFLIPRSPLQNSTMGEYTVPKGTKILINSWAIRRDPSIWDSPGEFKPERFLHDDAADFKGNSFQFIPFGSGRRICPGLPLISESNLTYSLSLFGSSHLAPAVSLAGVLSIGSCLAAKCLGGVCCEKERLKPPAPLNPSHPASSSPSLDSFSGRQRGLLQIQVGKSEPPWLGHLFPLSIAFSSFLFLYLLLLLDYLTCSFDCSIDLKTSVPVKNFEARRYHNSGIRAWFRPNRGHPPASIPSTPPPVRAALTSPPSGSDFRTRVECILTKENLWDAIYDRIDEHEADKTLAKLNAGARATVLLNLSSAIVRQVSHHRCAKDLWDALTNLFIAKSEEHMYSLQSQIMSFQMDPSKDVDTNMHEFTNLLKDIKLAGDDKIEAYAPQILLGAIPEMYAEVKSALKYGGCKLTCDMIVSGLKAKENEIKKLNSKPLQNKIIVDLLHWQMANNVILKEKVTYA
ncbi:hypothetical protein C2S52_005459 [Perilla frutescens var. hirtella]|nr:hypothetical protein C2S52_005459 [Perilla frutescens var. hirtella]